MGLDMTSDFRRRGAAPPMSMILGRFGASLGKWLPVSRNTGKSAPSL
jgi:hypothetical protein